jgi:hypothetical protein
LDTEVDAEDMNAGAKGDDGEDGEDDDDVC